MSQNLAAFFCEVRERKSERRVSDSAPLTLHSRSGDSVRSECLVSHSNDTVTRCCIYIQFARRRRRTCSHTYISHLMSISRCPPVLVFPTWAGEWTQTYWRQTVHQPTLIQPRCHSAHSRFTSQHFQSRRISYMVETWQVSKIELL